MFAVDVASAALFLFRKAGGMPIFAMFAMFAILAMLAILAILAMLAPTSASLLGPAIPLTLRPQRPSLNTVYVLC